LFGAELVELLAGGLQQPQPSQVSREEDEEEEEEEALEPPPGLRPG